MPEAYYFPVSYAQQRLWFLDQLWPATPLYHLWELLPLDLPISISTLESSLREIVARHEILRTTFVLRDGLLMQAISTVVDLTLVCEDLEVVPEDERPVEAARRAASIAAASFNLATGPLFRAHLYRLGECRYLLVIAMHHIISDGWSIAVLQKELWAIYLAFRAGRPSPLPPLGIQYSDYATWQRELLSGTLLNEQRQYWMTKLTGVPPLELPTDRPRAAKPSFRGESFTVCLGSDLISRLMTNGKRKNATLFMVLFAAFQVLLARYTNQNSFVVGTTIAGRSLTELEGLIGLFVNSLAIRCEVPGEATFDMLLDRVKEIALEAYANQDLPFEMLVEELKPQRDLSRNPIFQVLFQLQDDFTSSSSGHLNANAAPRSLPVISSPLDLSFSLSSTSSGVTGTLVYAVDLFEQTTMERLAVHYLSLLDAISRNPQQRIDRLSLMSGCEQRLLVEHWKPIPFDVRSAQKCVHHYIVEHAARSPDAVAVIDGTRSLSYDALDKQANQIARRLRRLGVGRGAIVALWISRSISWIAATLGVLKAGGAFLPIDPDYPSERQAFMLADSEVSAIITERDFVCKLPSGSFAQLFVDDPSLADEDSASADFGACIHDIAYVIYTSGSTGKPKGVMIQHSGLVNVVEAQIRTLGVTSRNRVLQFASPSFDASVFEIVMALCHGGCLCIMPGRFESATSLIDFLRQQQVDSVVLPPTVLGTLPARDCATLRLITVAGEPCPAELVTRWAGNGSFFNLYGPTEATIWASAARCANDGRRPSIGLPIQNVGMYLLNRYLEPVPSGMVGELFIGGAGVAQGYLKRPDLTAERFLPDPFVGGGARMFRTGDLARFRYDGELEFLGRVDDQIKIRGFRVELGEVEEAIRQHPAIEQVAVVAHGDGNSRRLIAYVVTGDSGPAATNLGLRSFLLDRVPAFMVPSDYVTLASLPLTPNGKVDRLALPPFDGRLRSDYHSPRTDLEKAICEIWQEILDLGKVGVDENFFELGGHSLLAVKAGLLVRKLLGRPISVADIFRNPTAESLAQFIGGSDDPASLFVRSRKRAAHQQRSLERRRLDSGKD